MAVDFSRFSNTDFDTTPFQYVIFGAKGGLLEVELNEAQYLGFLRDKIILNTIGNRVRGGSIIRDTNGETTIKGNFIIEGYAFSVSNAKITTNNGDSIYAKVSLETLDKDSVIHTSGYVVGEEIENTILDKRVGVETTKRMAIKLELSTTKTDESVKIAEVSSSGDPSLTLSNRSLTGEIGNVSSDLREHSRDTNNPHEVTKAQVGLGNVDNTADADKNVLRAQALSKYYAGDTDANMTKSWYKIATITLKAQYDDSAIHMLVYSIGDAGSYSYSAEVSVRLKQQKAMGTSPNSSVQVLNVNGFNPDQFRLYITTNSASVTVGELWCKITSPHRGHGHVFYALYENTTINSNMALHENPPSGNYVEGKIAGIQDNLTSDSIVNSLSAKQGKSLKGMVDTKLPLINSIGIKRINGNGKYLYFKIATITITNQYCDQPICFELSGRGRALSMLTVIFMSSDGIDPSLSYFTSNNDNRFWIKKTATSTWEIYGQYSETWGTYSLHRITGDGLNGISVDINMTSIDALPSECKQAVYGGTAGYSDTANALTTSAGSSTQPVYFSDGKPVACEYTLEKSDISSKASGETPLIVNGSTKGNIISFKGNGYTEQKQYSGKNLLNSTHQTITVSGVTCTNNGDGTYTLNGTATAQAEFHFNINKSFSKDTKVLGCKNGSNNTFFISYKPSINTWSEKYDYGSGINIPAGVEIYSIAIVLRSGATVNNVLFKPMITEDLNATYDDFEPYVGGIPSPNPDYPQPIHGYGSSGWFDGELVQGIIIGEDGRYHYQENCVSPKRLTKYSAGDVITLKTQNVVDILGVMGTCEDLYYNNGVIGHSIGRDGYNVNEITVSEDSVGSLKEFIFYIEKTGVTPRNVGDLVGDITVLKNGKYAVPVKTRGKNLLNYDEWKGTEVRNGNAYYENYGVTLDAFTEDCYTFFSPELTSKIDVQPGKTYTLSWEVDSTKAGSVYIFPNGTTSGMKRTNNIMDKKLSFKAGENCTFITFRFGVAHEDDVISYKNIQFEEGEIATEFEPYQEPSVLIPTSQPFYQGDYIQLNSDGSGVEHRENGVINPKSVDKVISDNNYLLNCAQVNLQGKNCRSIKSSYSNYFIAYNNDNNDNILGKFTFSNNTIGNYSDLFFRIAGFNTLNEYNTWLANHPDCIFVYPLANPTDTPLTKEQVTEIKKIMSFNNQTTFSDIKSYHPEIEVEYYKNTNNGIVASNLEDRINKIYLGTSKIINDITSRVSDLPLAVAEQNLEKYGYKIGDYFRGSYYLYFLADMNTFKATDSYVGIPKNHITIVVNTFTGSEWSTSTGTEKDSDYSSSTFHDFLKQTATPKIQWDLERLFGSSEHLLCKRFKQIPNGLNSTTDTSDDYFNALSEMQILGIRYLSANMNQTADAYKKLELFNRCTLNELGLHGWLQDLHDYSYDGSEDYMRYVAKVCECSGSSLGAPISWGENDYSRNVIGYITFC